MTVVKYFMCMIFMSLSVLGMGQAMGKPGNSATPPGRSVQRECPRDENRAQCERAKFEARFDKPAPPKMGTPSHPGRQGPGMGTPSHPGPQRPKIGAPLRPAPRKSLHPEPGHNR